MFYYFYHDYYAIFEMIQAFEETSGFDKKGSLDMLSIDTFHPISCSLLVMEIVCFEYFV